MFNVSLLEKFIYISVCVCVLFNTYSQERAWASSRACWVAIVCILLWDTEPLDRSVSRSKSVNKMKIFYHIWEI